MYLISTLEVPGASETKHIKLYEGDLADIPAGEEVDLLVVSAFPDAYVPTPTSLIGALHRKGLSVERLARDKEMDLRKESSCWISKDISGRHPGFGFRRILCFEPAFRGHPARVVGDVFRSMIPLATLDEPPLRTVAMPLLASGDQNADPLLMLSAIIDAGMHWMKNDLPITTLKIVQLSWGPAMERLPSVLAREPRHFVRRPESS